MFDKDLLFTTLDTPATPQDTTKVGANIHCGPGTYTISVIVSPAPTGNGLDLQIRESNDDFVSDDEPLADFPNIMAAGEYTRRITTRKDYLQLYCVAVDSGSPKIVVAGITDHADGAALSG